MKRHFDWPSGFLTLYEDGTITVTVDDAASPASQPQRYHGTIDRETSERLARELSAVHTRLRLNALFSPTPLRRRRQLRRKAAR